MVKKLCLLFLMLALALSAAAWLGLLASIFYTWASAFRVRRSRLGNPG